MDIEELLTTTRSARRSLDLDAPIELDDIRDCLRIALHAANGSNQQAWRWVIVTDKALRDKISDLYRAAYLAKVGGQMISGLMPAGTPEAKLMSSTEWLVEHLADIPALVIPCYEATMPRTPGDESFYLATLYGSIFPAVWNFALALHTRGYGTCITTLHLHHEAEVRDLLGIPESFTQGCLLPVGRLRTGFRFSAAPRRAIDEVIGINGWEGK
ncbi:nitroreductase [Mycolicibacterium moriokaense]|uniref:Oxidoreductase n=1 Tax=Mycolicibacterium moriokaense TaxID=39691 RepID=A0AAD1HFF7_9MYCO|nr:nitroreductase family protein [Mycolicibacterium moriokaense]MCV7040403.1 nitroreductase family protein [Mycolicibacterium moriokaense]ORB26094.1 nitroreductase [Mycolicibacterium moriokaense]BBX03351.1 oxidoreductase [Mycolicibacterium moriokaense]